MSRIRSILSFLFIYGVVAEGIHQTMNDEPDPPAYLISPGLIVSHAEQMSLVVKNAIENIKKITNAAPDDIRCMPFVWVDGPDICTENGIEVYLKDAAVKSIIIHVTHHFETLVKGVVSHEVSRYINYKRLLRMDSLDLAECFIILAALNLKVQELHTFPKYQLLQDVSNTMKHGFGRSSHALYEKMPSYFATEISVPDRRTAKIIKNQIIGELNKSGANGATLSPQDTEAIKFIDTGDPNTIYIEPEEAIALISAASELFDEMKKAAQRAALSQIVNRFECD